MAQFSAQLRQALPALRNDFVQRAIFFADSRSHQLVILLLLPLLLEKLAPAQIL